MDAIVQEQMFVGVYWNGNQPYLAQYQLQAMGFGHLIKPNMPGGYQPFTMKEIEDIITEYNKRNPYIRLTATDMEYPKELVAGAPVSSPSRDPMVQAALETVNRAGFGR